MSPIALRQLFFASIFSSLFVGAISKPTAYPNQYAEHALRKWAALNVVQTTYTDTHTLDWIPIESQGIIASPPPPRHQYNNNTLTPELEAPGAVKGPAGTVPVPRMNPEYLARAAPKQTPSTSPSKQKSKRQYSGDHWYVSSNQGVSNIGGYAVFSLFDAFVDANDFSLLQTCVGTSSQTLEAGWINYPLNPYGSPNSASVLRFRKKPWFSIAIARNAMRMQRHRRRTNSDGGRQLKKRHQKAREIEEDNMWDSC